MDSSSPTALAIYPGQRSIDSNAADTWRSEPEWRRVSQANVHIDFDLESALRSGAYDCRVTDLCTFVLSVMGADAARRRGIRFAAHAGYSVGQLSALTAAGVLPFDQGVRVVRERAEAIADAARRRGGAMAVYRHLPGAGYDAINAALRDSRPIWVASYDSPGQTVIAGTQVELERLQANPHLSARAVARIPTSAAVHTPLMTVARSRIARLMDSIPLRPEREPVLTSAEGTVEDSLTAWHRKIAADVSQPILWHQTICRLLAIGRNSTPLIELGPHQHSSGFIRRFHRGRSAQHLRDPSSIDAWAHQQRSASQLDDYVKPEIGECLPPEWGRMITSPYAGTVSFDHTFLPGEPIMAGDRIATVQNQPVVANSSGSVGDVRVLPDERVVEHQPMLWLRAAPS